MPQCVGLAKLSTATSFQVVITIENTFLDENFGVSGITGVHKLPELLGHDVLDSPCEDKPGETTSGTS
jgi:hypothetical protein